jgi:hypothetical protein
MLAMLCHAGVTQRMTREAWHCLPAVHRNLQALTDRPIQYSDQEKPMDGGVPWALPERLNLQARDRHT